MEKNFIEKWNYLNQWFKVNHLKVYREDFYKYQEFKVNNFNEPANDEEINNLELLLSDEIPQELREILKIHNGEIDLNNSPFFEQRLLSTKEIKEQIEFALSLKKPINRHISNSEKSNNLIIQIVNEVKLKLKSKLELSTWFKITFQGGEIGLRMPTIYKNEFNLEERENISIDKVETLKLIKLLQKEEKNTYDWDDVEFTIYFDGTIKTDRTDTDWSFGITSFPENSVKEIYFHYKWIPVFSDNAGNYIGIDLDPKKNGIKGQVIIYGRDTYQNTKIADNLDELFTKIIKDIKNEKESILLIENKYHLHERLKSLTKIFCA